MRIKKVYRCPTCDRHVESFFDYEWDPCDDCCGDDDEAGWMVVVKMTDVQLAVWKLGGLQAYLDLVRDG